MTGFAALAGLMVLLVLITIGYPLLGALRTKGQTASPTLQEVHAQVNADILRDQYLKLQRDKDDGLISADDLDRAQDELRRSMAREAVEQPKALAAPKSPIKLLLSIAVFVPLLAAGLYVTLGHPDAMVTSLAPDHARAGDYENMVSTLQAKLQKDPSNLKGWVMLGRSYKVLSRPQDAQDAFAHAEELIATDAQMLADYADVLASNAGGQFSDKADTLLARALRLDPSNVMALWLAGTSAVDHQQYAKAVALWERAMPQLAPQSEDARTLQAAIDEARRSAGLPVTTTTALRSKQSAPATAAHAPALLSGNIDLAPALHAQWESGMTLMIVARAPGVRMPVAVLRAHVDTWPYAFTLSDANALNEQNPLSSLHEVELEARLSKSGMAMPQPRDMMSAAQILNLGAKSIKLSITKTRP
jgi:cytochrome c-type biogenesis protein CcmH